MKPDAALATPSHPKPGDRTSSLPGPISLAPESSRPTAGLPPPIAMLGVPFDQVTTADTLEVIRGIIASGLPHYAATANVDFVVQARGDLELRRILTEADLVLCDGMPLVWASGFLGRKLPERVTGSDLVPLLLAEAAREGWRVFFLGGTEESIAGAAQNVQAQHPALKLVGAYSPPFRSLLEMDHEAIVQRVKAAKPDLLFVAFGCPKQEKWINMHFRRAGVPLSIGVGATIDFLAGTVRRAPVWMQRSGLEWVFRWLQEPRRLFRRYVTGLWVFGREILRQGWALGGRRTSPGEAARVQHQVSEDGFCEVVEPGPRLEVGAIQENAATWAKLASSVRHLLLDINSVQVVDSTGIGLLVRLQKQMRAAGRQLVLVGTSQPLRRALDLMGFTELLTWSPDQAAAQRLVQERLREEQVVAAVCFPGHCEPLVWQGEIVAANVEEVWLRTSATLAEAQGELTIQLSGVRFIDSTGVSLMVRVRKAAALRGVTVRFVDAPAGVRNVLRVLRMESTLLA